MCVGCDSLMLIQLLEACILEERYWATLSQVVVDLDWVDFYIGHSTEH